VEENSLTCPLGKVGGNFRCVALAFSEQE